MQPTTGNPKLTDQRRLRAHPHLELVKSGARRSVQSAIDGVQLRVDTFPRMPYQPVPWIGKVSSGRAEGTFERWNSIQADLETLAIDSALDVGCQAGFFVISLAELSIPALGIDIDPRSLRIARQAARRAGVDIAGWCQLDVNAQTVALLPSVDAVLALSVWHHWVWSHGLEAAGLILSRLWDRSAKVLYFETGQAEMPAEFGLPDMTDDPETWIASYLSARCPGSTVTVLGRHKAFGVGGDETKNVAYRTLFAAHRTHSSP